MRLTRHFGSRWAVDGRLLRGGQSLAGLLALTRADMLEALAGGDPAEGEMIAPCDLGHEIWASGVTYLRSREEREKESSVADVYGRVYDAVRPELFFKAVGWRVKGHGEKVRVRQDSDWNVPEPELTLVVNRFGEIVGYTAGNDVSSRSIEGENPLYLPQAKVYDGSCALGSGIEIVGPESMADLPIRLEIIRAGDSAFRGETSTSAMRRNLDELVHWLFKECSFPSGVFLMTGTGIVPPHPFSLLPGDRVRITVGDASLENSVEDYRG